MIEAHGPLSHRQSALIIRRIERAAFAATIEGQMQRIGRYVRNRVRKLERAREEALRPRLRTRKRKASFSKPEESTR